MNVIGNSKAYERKQQVKDAMDILRQTRRYFSRGQITEAREQRLEREYNDLTHPASDLGLLSLGEHADAV